MKKNKVIFISVLLILTLGSLLVVRWNISNGSQETTVSLDETRSSILVTYPNKVADVKLTEKKQELPPLVEYEKNYLPQMVDYGTMKEGSASLSGKISPKQFNQMKREISKLEWEDLSLLLEQKYSLQLGISYPISAFPEQNKDGSREYYCEKYIFKEQGMVLLYFSIPQYDNKGDIAMFFTIDNDGNYIGETALILDIMKKYDNGIFTGGISLIRGIDIKEYNGVKWFIFNCDTNLARPYIGYSFWYNLTTGKMDLSYTTGIEADTPYSLDHYAGGFTTEKEEINWDAEGKKLTIDLARKYKIFLFGEMQYKKKEDGEEDNTFEKTKAYHLEYDFEAMRFYVDSEKDSFELSNLSAPTIYDVFREELSEMQDGTEAEQKWLSRILGTMKSEQKRREVKYIDRPDIHKDYIIVDPASEGIENKGILKVYYKNIERGEKLRQYFNKHNNGGGDLRKGLKYGFLFFNVMLENIESGNVKVKNYEFEKEDLSVSVLKNIKTLKDNIVFIVDDDNQDMWMYNYIIQRPSSKNMLGPEIRKNNRIVWLVLRDKETVDGKNLVKNMWFNLYTQQTDLIYWTEEGEGSKELMTDEKGEVYLQIDADINKGLINSDGAKLYYDFNCMRFYTV